eukprot:3300942-Pleurochrysis_carterae.AAC.1
MSTFSKSETGPSSSTFHRAESGRVVRVEDEEVVDVAAERQRLLRAIDALLQTNIQGSEEDCWNPQSMSQGKRERCQRRPACAMP